jgi:hypothetical protein
MSTNQVLHGTPSAANPLWGVNFSQGECLGFFTEYQKCYVQADIPEKECKLWLEDYSECKLKRREVCCPAMTIIRFIIILISVCDRRHA